MHGVLFQLLHRKMGRTTGPNQPGCLIIAVQMQGFLGLFQPALHIGPNRNTLKEYVGSKLALKLSFEP